MGKIKKKAKYSADFETTTELEDCRVWAVGLCSIDENFTFSYTNNFDDFLKWCANQNTNYVLYFHNLKFDGDFIFNYLFINGYKLNEDRKKLKSREFSCLISDTGQFFSLEIMFDDEINNKVTIYDSLKILPFKVAEVAKAFDLPCQKSEIDYGKKRPVGYKLDDEEILYLKNDVEIIARALKTLFDENLTQMTQASNAMKDYKKIIGSKKFEKYFPRPAYDEDVRQCYKGGFTYLNPKYRNKDIYGGIVLDVNSLYPSVMYNDFLPYGEPIYYSGKYQEDSLYNIYIQMFSCSFVVKEGYIPTVQLKGFLGFIPNEYVETTNGEIITLCMTCIDFKLFCEHYDVYNLTFYGGWKFKSTNILFREYIDKWYKIKEESTINGNKGMRTLAKLMMNSLYGKFALNPHVQSKFPYLTENGVKYYLGEKEERPPIYIPIGAFITAYARNKTIRSAQSLYDRFIYADTDSLHLVGEELPKNLEIHDTKLGAWAHESTFTKGKFLRQKTYIEEIKGEIHITCAGMPTKCYENVTWENFKAGSSFAGKLMPKHVKGGTVLVDTDFTIKG